MISPGITQPFKLILDTRNLWSGHVLLNQADWGFELCSKWDSVCIISSHCWGLSPQCFFLAISRLAHISSSSWQSASLFFGADLMIFLHDVLSLLIWWDVWKLRRTLDIYLSNVGLPNFLQHRPLFSGWTSPFLVQPQNFASIKKSDLSFDDHHGLPQSIPLFFYKQDRADLHVRCGHWELYHLWRGLEMPRWFPMRLPQVTMGFNNSNGRMNWMIWGTTIGIYIYI